VTFYTRPPVRPLHGAAMPKFWRPKVAPAEQLTCQISHWGPLRQDRPGRLHRLRADRGPPGRLRDGRTDQTGPPRHCRAGCPVEYRADVLTARKTIKGIEDSLAYTAFDALAQAAENNCLFLTMSNQMNTTTKKYPAGALVRISDICRHQKTGTPGLLPIDRSTWHRWEKKGTVPQGMRLAGSSTRVWPIELILSLANPKETADS